MQSMTAPYWFTLFVLRLGSAQRISGLHQTEMTIWFFGDSSWRRGEKLHGLCPELKFTFPKSLQQCWLLPDPVREALSCACELLVQPEWEEELHSQISVLQKVPLIPASTQTSPSLVAHPPQQYTLLTPPFHSTLLQEESPAEIKDQRPSSLGTEVPPTCTTHI